MRGNCWRKGGKRRGEKGRKEGRTTEESRIEIQNEESRVKRGESRGRESGGQVSSIKTSTLGSMGAWIERVMKQRKLYYRTSDIVSSNTECTEQGAEIVRGLKIDRYLT